MKNNAIVALVILLVTIAFLVVVNDLSKSKTPTSAQVDVHAIQR